LGFALRELEFQIKGLRLKSWTGFTRFISERSIKSLIIQICHKGTKAQRIEIQNIIFSVFASLW